MTEQIEQSGQVREQDPYRKSRVMYIIEAAVEYFIATMIAGAYLAKVTDAIGMTDAQTGIVSSFVSLGWGFQLISIFLSRFTPVKRWVSVLNTLNQLLFALVYAVPFVPVSQPVKIGLFVSLLLVGELIANLVNSPKTNWFMSLVPDRQRGRFTANKEIVSLMGGVAFTFAMGALNDHFHAIGRSDIAFMICGFAIFGLALIHMLTLVLSKEKPVESKPQAVGRQISTLVRDKNLWMVIVVITLYKISQYAVTPFLGTYQNKELGFTLTAVSALGALYSVVRSLFSRPIGRLADKTSFSRMLQLGFLLEALAYLSLVFTGGALGQAAFVIYKVLNAISMAGINSGCINLVYDYVAPERRVGALALQNTVAGVVGFFTTLVASAFVDHVQAQGNRLFGVHMYAQQALSAISCVVCLLVVVYLHLVVGRSQRAVSSDTV